MGKPFIINAETEPTADNKHSWFPLIGNPPGESGPGGFKVMWGVLRPEYRGFRPSLAAFVQAKLAVAAGPDAVPWSVTTHRHEVVLPPHAGDHLLDPRTLVEAAEREQSADRKALATYLTLTSAPNRLHAQYEVARELGRWLANSFEVAVLLVQHVPSLNAGSAQPHVHLIIPGPRRLTAWSGFGSPVADLARDKGRDVVVEKLAALVGGPAA